MVLKGALKDSKMKRNLKISKYYKLFNRMFLQFIQLLAP